MKDILKNIMEQQSAQDLNSYIRAFLAKLPHHYFIYQFSNGNRYIEIDGYGSIWYFSNSKKKLLQLPDSYLLPIAQAINMKSNKIRTLSDAEWQKYLSLFNK